MMSSGTSALVRCTCSATGRILSSAKRRNVSATSSKSSERCVGPVPCFAHWSASASRNAGARCAATNGVRGRERRRIDAPQRARGRRAGPRRRRRRRRRTRGRASTRPRRARRTRTSPASASTAAAACARSYATTWCSSSFGDRELAVVERSRRRGCATAASTTVAGEVDRGGRRRAVRRCSCRARLPTASPRRPHRARQGVGGASASSSDGRRSVVGGDVVGGVVGRRRRRRWSSAWSSPATVGGVVAGVVVLGGSVARRGVGRRAVAGAGTASCGSSR